MAATALAAITGLGFSELSRKPISSIRDLAIAAIDAAVANAGLQTSDIDGLLLCRSPLATYDDLPLKIQDDLGFYDLRLLSSVDAEGSSTVQAIQQATMAIRQGMARAVVCVFSDAPLIPGTSGSSAFNLVMPMTGIDGWEARYGLFGAVGPYALAARRYMAEYGATEEHLGAYAIANRQWAQRNPLAFLRSPLSMEQYLASRWIVEPFRMLDCAYPVNGAIAVVVTASERAADAPRPAVYIHGLGQGHAGLPGMRGFDREIRTGAEIAGQGAYRMAGVNARDVAMCQFYDAFSYTGIQSLEDYGLCRRGEAAAFVAAGHTAPGGRLPVNTGGGHLSGYYLQGMTPVAEAVLQARGDGGERQVDKRDVILVSGNGGRMDYHAALIVSPLKSLA